MKKVLFMAMVVTILLTQTASAAPWQMRRNQLIFDSKIGFLGNVTLQFASDGGSFIRPITKRYGESISLYNCIFVSCHNTNNIARQNTIINNTPKQRIKISINVSINALQCVYLFHFAETIVLFSKNIVNLFCY